MGRVSRNGGAVAALAGRGGGFVLLLLHELTGGPVSSNTALHSLTLRWCDFLGRLAAPVLFKARTPVPECSSGYTIKMQDIPSVCVARLAVGAESVNLAIRNDGVWRGQASGSDGGHKGLLDLVVVDHLATSTRTMPAAATTAMAV